MGWNSSSTWVSIGTGYQLDWELASSGLRVRSGRSVSKLYSLTYFNSSYNFKSNKTYQFITQTKNIFATSASFSITPYAWSDKLTYRTGLTPSVSYASTQSFIHYSRPDTNYTATNYATYQANATFSSANSYAIYNIEVNELDYIIQGYSYYKLYGNNLEVSNDVRNSLGWYYDKSQDTYAWYDRVSNNTISITSSNGTDFFIASTESRVGMYPVGGPNGSKDSNFGYRLNNYVAKQVTYPTFNLYFNYTSNSLFPLKIYLGQQLPAATAPTDIVSLFDGTLPLPYGTKLIASLTQSENGGASASSHAFFGLKGNQYIYFVGPYVGATGSTYCTHYLTNIYVEGGYHSGNNRQHLTSLTGSYAQPTVITPLGLTGATFSILSGYGNTVNATQSLTVSKILSKIGNGKFSAGIWENGVWNSGWRVDENMLEFWGISQMLGYNNSKRWRILLNGPSDSVSSLSVGDLVSIGNIVAIDINEDRRLLKGYYTVVSKTTNNIVVEFDTDLPIRRIEQDSLNHRIYVTRNVWLSGGFLNGYFTGIWNYGLFKGYPLITEMYNSHWIDGTFDGGHFYSEKYTIPPFVDTVFSAGSVGLTFSLPHGLAVGDLITIDKSDKTVNPEYDGDHYVTEITSTYSIVIDQEWGQDSNNEGGNITINLSKGLIQKFKFKDHNIAKSTSTTNFLPTSESVFVFNSWIDVNFFETSSVNIGKPVSINNSRVLGRRNFSENNLYGYPTLDVLESESSFRDSFSKTIRKYKLGTKMKVYYNYIGDSGRFQDYWGPSGSNSEQGVSQFLSYGWTFSTDLSSTMTFSRTQMTSDGLLQPDYQYVVQSNPYSLVDGFEGQELKVEVTHRGGILEIQSPTINVNNRDDVEIERNRYTVVEFDLITFSSVNYSEKKFVKGGDFTPKIHFNNVNFTTFQVDFGSSFGGINPVTFPMSYLPVYKNVEHTLTKQRRKVDYFFNKRHLSMNFKGNYGSDSTTTYIVDNVQLLEVDMIPFFQYFTENNINKGVEVPFQGISPYIDYSNQNFNFLDNISIGLGSIQTQNSFGAISGVGIGIGVGAAPSISVGIQDAGGNAEFNGSIMFGEVP